MSEQRLKAIFDNMWFERLWLLIPLLIFAASWWFLRREAKFVKVVSSLLFAISTWIFCAGAQMSWMLRDGMGPDSMETHGAEAVARFKEQFVPLTTLCTAIFGLGVLLLILAKIFNKRRCA